MVILSSQELERLRKLDRIVAWFSAEGLELDRQTNLRSKALFAGFGTTVAARSTRWPQSLCVRDRLSRYRAGEGRRPRLVGRVSVAQHWLMFGSVLPIVVRPSTM